jgi:hypothetical protein
LHYYEYYNSIIIHHYIFNSLCLNRNSAEYRTSACDCIAYLEHHCVIGAIRILSVCSQEAHGQVCCVLYRAQRLSKNDYSGISRVTIYFKRWSPRVIKRHIPSQALLNINKLKNSLFYISLQAIFNWQPDIISPCFYFTCLEMQK